MSLFWQSLVNKQEKQNDIEQKYFFSVIKLKFSALLRLVIRDFI
jgi:hypothetical protein